MSERVLPLNLDCPDCGAAMQLVAGHYRCPWVKHGTRPREQFMETRAGTFLVQTCAWPLRDMGLRAKPDRPLDA